MGKKGEINGHLAAGGLTIGHALPIVCVINELSVHCLSASNAASFPDEEQQHSIPSLLFVGFQGSPVFQASLNFK